MAGGTHSVDIGDDDLLPPWSTVSDVVGATDGDDWVLVGGLMVQLHAYRAGIAPPRATRDMDMVIDVAAPATSFVGVAASLRMIGFEPLVPDRRSSPIYRFQRAGEQIDVMVADHLPSRMNPRYRMRPAFAVDAGEQAIRRRDTFVVSSPRGTFELGAPDTLGALVVKGAANIVDQRDPGRHLEDAAVLLSSIDTVGGLDLEDLSVNDRKRLRRVAAGLSGDDAPAWGLLAPVDRLRGRQNLLRLVIAAEL